MAAKDSGLRVDFSSEEANSEALDFDPIPSGKYHVKITEVTDKECGPESKNPGKPYWNVEMTVQDGEFNDRKLWGNVMLFNGALYSLSQILKATGNQKALESGAIPAKETLITKDLIVVVLKQRDTYKEAQANDGQPLFKNEVKGYKAWSEGALAGTSSSGASLMP